MLARHPVQPGQIPAPSPARRQALRWANRCDHQNQRLWTAGPHGTLLATAVLPDNLRGLNQIGPLHNEQGAIVRLPGVDGAGNRKHLFALIGGQACGDQGARL